MYQEKDKPLTAQQASGAYAIGKMCATYNKTEEGITKYAITEDEKPFYELGIKHETEYQAAVKERIK